MPRANLVDHKKKVIISINYKCASSVILRWFRSNLVGYKHENLILSNVINRKYVFSDGRLHNYEGYYKIVIVRNPFNRVISAFLDKGFHKFIPLENLCKKHRTTIENLTFRQFLKILQQEDPKKMNGHWKPLMTDNKPDMYDKIIKMEFIGKHMNAVARRFKYTPFPVKSHKKKKKDKNLCDVPIKKLRKMPDNLVRNYKNYFDGNAILIVKNIYGDDLNNFNYSYSKFRNS